jgi:hypothetical protein
MIGDTIRNIKTRLETSGWVVEEPRPAGETMNADKEVSIETSGITPIEGARAGRQAGLMGVSISVSMRVRLHPGAGVENEADLLDGFEEVNSCILFREDGAGDHEFRGAERISGDDYIGLRASYDLHKSVKI